MSLLPVAHQAVVMALAIRNGGAGSSVVLIKVAVHRRHALARAISVLGGLVDDQLPVRPVHARNAVVGACRVLAVPTGSTSRVARASLYGI